MNPYFSMAYFTILVLKLFHIWLMAASLNNSFTFVIYPHYFFFFFRAVPVAYGSSQARGQKKKKSELQLPAYATAIAT